MREHFYHGGDKHKNILLVEVLLSFPEIGLEVGNAFLHLYVPFLEGVDIPLLFLQDKTPPVLNYIGMRIGFDLGK